MLLTEIARIVAREDSGTVYVNKNKAREILSRILEAVDGARLTEEKIAKVLANTLGTKLKFESRLTDQDRLAFKDEMRLELHAVINAQLHAIKKLFEEEK